MTDGPAVLGLARFVELDEQYALEPAVQALEAANAAGRSGSKIPRPWSSCCSAR